MTLVLSVIITKETEKLIPILPDAEESEERIRTALADEKNTNYAALEGEELVGAATVKWQAQESEILSIAVIQKCRGRGYGKTIIEGLKNEMRCRGVHSLVVGTANSSIENKENDILMRDMLVFWYEP